MSEVVKKEKAKKPSIFSRIGNWAHEMKVELKKVQWSTKKQTAHNTVVVIGCVFIVGSFIWVFDFLASNLIQALISLVK